MWVGLGGGKELGWDSDERRIQCDSNSAGHSVLSAIVLLSVPKPMPLHRERSHLERPTPKPLRLSQPPLRNEADTQKQTLHRRLREVPCPRPRCSPGPRRVGRGVGGLALEPQLLVLGSDVVPEQLQGLLHGSLGVGAEVPGVLALQDLDDDFRDELRGGEGKGAGHGPGPARSQVGMRPSPVSFCCRCLLLSSSYLLGASEWSLGSSLWNPHDPRDRQMGHPRIPWPGGPAHPLPSAALPGGGPSRSRAGAAAFTGAGEGEEMLTFRGFTQDLAVRKSRKK